MLDDEVWEHHEGCNQRIRQLEQDLTRVLDAFDTVYHRYRAADRRMHQALAVSDESPPPPSPHELRKSIGR